MNEVKLEEVEGSLPCVICPTCAADDVTMLAAAPRKSPKNGAVEDVIRITCDAGHGWSWVLTDWEGRTFFAVVEGGANK